MTKRYAEGRWFFSMEKMAMVHIRAGEYEMNEQLPAEAYELELPTHLLMGLVETAREAGLIPVLPSKETRQEDLKIVHRLLDILAMVRLEED